MRAAATRTHQASASARLYVNRYGLASPMTHGRHVPARRRACFTLRGALKNGRASSRPLAPRGQAGPPPPPRAAAPRPGAAPPFLRSLPLLRNGVGDEGCGVAVRARNCVRAAEGWQLAFDRSALALATLRRAAGVACVAGAVAPGGAASARRRACRRLPFQGFGGFRLLQAAPATPPRSFRPAGLRTRLLGATWLAAARVQSWGQPEDALSATLRVSPCCCVPAHCPRCPTAAAFLIRGADNVPRAPAFASSAGCTFAG